MKPSSFYVLSVRFPTGGIRTHLKYARQLVENDPRELRPVLVCPDDAEGHALAATLGLQSDFVQYAQGLSVHSLALATFGAARKFGAKVIHSHGFTSAITSFPAALLPGRRHVVTVHDVVTQGMIANQSKAALTALGLAMRQAYAIHAVGQDSAESVRQLPFMTRASHLRIIPNGINVRQFTNVTRVDLRGQLNLVPNTFIVGFFGRFMAQKGFRLLVDAVKVISQRNLGIRIAVVTFGSGGFVREDQSYIASLGLSEAFHFWGFVEDPAKFMASVDVVVMPSRWEAYGLVAAEVMAVGTPLIASDCLGLREVINGTPARSFTNGSVDELVECLLAEHRSNTKKEAADYAPIAVNRFDFQPHARDIQNLLLEANDA